MEVVNQFRALNPRLRAVAVLNCADARGSDNNDVLGALEKYEGLEVSDQAIVRRKAWPNAASAGLSVLELAPSAGSTAQDEFNNLLRSLYPALTMKGKAA
jgi:chromosome partitioning protein